VTAATTGGASWTRDTLTTWGRARYAHTLTRPAAPDDAEIAGILTTSEGPVIVYGSGRCYGDGALNDGGRTILSRARRQIESIDRETGVVVAQSGASFDDLSVALHGIGFTYPVAAATGAVTLGGALVNDLHAKNHHSAGSFGKHVLWFDLMLADGSIVRVDRESEPDLFAATVGGLGLTGMLLRVALKLKPIAAPAVDASYRRIPDIDAFLDAIEPRNLSSAFWFGWVDVLARGKEMGRGILETGDYAPDASGMLPAPKPTSIPVTLPHLALHPLLIERYNARRFARLPAAGLSVRKPISPFYFPLDHIKGFNRVYGPKGFYSAHFGIPYSERDCVKKLLAEISQARAGSIAAVLKPMGGPGEGLMSFPFKGIAFAVDLPRRAGVEALHERLERIALAHGGRLYVAKDALMTPEGYAAMFPNLDRFREILRRVDPKGRFQSDMSRRLRIRPELGKPS
jgi:decaprenylphospho-beta-D-ribofuranose 2-oxidase